MHVLDIEKKTISNFISLLFIQTAFNSRSHNIGTISVKLKWNNIQLLHDGKENIKIYSPMKNHIFYFFFENLI